MIYQQQNHQIKVPECNVEQCNGSDCPSGIKAVYYSPCKQMCDNLSKKCSIYSQGYNVEWKETHQKCYII